MCPGLAMGIRAAEIALVEIGAHSMDEEVVAVVETDMCAIDAIQYLPPDIPDKRNFSVNGLRAQSNNFLLDGADNNDGFLGTAAGVPSSDSLQEFRILITPIPPTINTALIFSATCLICARTTTTPAITPYTVAVNGTTPRNFTERAKKSGVDLTQNVRFKNFAEYLKSEIFLSFRLSFISFVR